MTATLLNIVQDICDEVGLNRPAVVAGSTDVQVRLLYALVNRATRELQQNYDWTALQTEYDLHVGQPLITTGDVILNSYQITNIPDTTGIEAQLWVCNAQFIPVAARVVSVDSPTQVTLSEPATGTQAAVSCTFAKDTYPEPVDFDRFINQTWWDRTNRWALLGPDSPQVDQWHRSGVVTIGPRRHFRQIGSIGTVGGEFNPDFGPDFSITGLRKNYRLWPPPGATDTPINIVFEYITKNIVQCMLGAGQPTFQADTDIAVIDENSIILDTIWRYLKRKGFDYSQEQADARDYADRSYANDGGAKTLSLPGRRSNFLLTTAQVQDGNFPGPGVSGA